MFKTLWKFYDWAFCDWVFLNQSNSIMDTWQGPKYASAESLTQREI